VNPVIEFYFDFGSPYSYLAQTQLAALTEKSKAFIAHMPISVIDIIKIAGNRPTSLECPNKKKYVKADLQRWVQRYRVPWQSNPHFRTIDLKFLLRAAIRAIDCGFGPQFVSNVFHGLYAEARNLGDPVILRDFLSAKGLPAKDILDLIDSEQAVADLDARTNNANAKGLFGVPSFIVGTDIFFGNDRLDFVAIAAKAAA
jgi:2-hydroxychromene-2-carboxylate isomerase